MLFRGSNKQAENLANYLNSINKHTQFKHEIQTNNKLNISDLVETNKFDLIIVVYINSNIIVYIHTGKTNRN